MSRRLRIPTTSVGRPTRPLAPATAGLLAVVLAVVMAVLGWLAPAPAGWADDATERTAPPSYVALGDSFSSGVGTRSYLDDGACRRSAHAFPRLVAAELGYALTFRACSGATTGDVADRQLDALSARTRYVTISVGGNDAGFASVLTACALPRWASHCLARIDTAREFIAGTLPGRLSRLYAAMRARAPRARVVVVGYPRLFNGEDCDLATFFSPTEEARLNRTADLLNGRLSAAARARGFRFADPRGRFAGHAICDDRPWINGLSHPVRESYHPNRTGQASGYRPVVAALLR